MTEEFAALYQDDFGLYLHIPFCKSICYYCDFYKTAKTQTQIIPEYFNALLSHLKAWSLSAHLPEKKWTSMFVGGGTPSLFLAEYDPILTVARERMAADCEITLEANVDDITFDRLSGWRALGFNRLSLGVQSLRDKHLKFLTRTHDAKKALHAIELCRDQFQHLNVDMIYGMPEHNPDEWQEDLSTLADLGIGHLSLYNLTYETRTPLAKFLKKGRFTPLDEASEASLYKITRDLLSSRGYSHEEVSNWALPGQTCRHNWLYWQDRPYLGIGAAAHSYLSHEFPWGVRFAYPPIAASFIASKPPLGPTSLTEMITGTGGIVDERDAAGWVLETVWCGLRTNLGIDPKRISLHAKCHFSPTPLVKRGLAEGALYWHKEKLFLDTGQWFCESSWSLAVASSFIPI